MGLDGLMYLLGIYSQEKIGTTDSASAHNRCIPQRLQVHMNDANNNLSTTQRRMHYSPLPYGTCLLCDAPPVLLVSRGDPLLLSPGQLSSHAVNMRMINAISAGLCVVICMCRPCRHPCAFYCKINDIFLPGQT